MFFTSYSNSLVNTLRSHPHHDEILEQLGPELSSDEVICVLCRNLGLNPQSWSLYTGSLDPPARRPQINYSLHDLDQLLLNFHSRFGQIVVLSDPALANTLRTHFNIVNVIEISEFEMLRRQAETISWWYHSMACVVIGLVGDCETALMMINGHLKSMTINSAPLQLVRNVFIVGRLRERFPPHLHSGLGEDFKESQIVNDYYRRAKVTKLSSVLINGYRSGLARWSEVVSNPTFICFSRSKGTLRRQDGSIVLRQHELEDPFAFVVRANTARLQGSLEGEDRGGR